MQVGCHDVLSDDILSWNVTFFLIPSFEIASQYESDAERVVLFSFRPALSQKSSARWTCLCFVNIFARLLLYSMRDCFIAVYLRAFVSRGKSKSPGSLRSNRSHLINETRFQSRALWYGLAVWLKYRLFKSLVRQLLILKPRNLVSITAIIARRFRTSLIVGFSFRLWILLIDAF